MAKVKSAVTFELRLDHEELTALGSLARTDANEHEDIVALAELALRSIITDLVADMREQTSQLERTFDPERFKLWRQREAERVAAGKAELDPETMEEIFGSIRRPAKDVPSPSDGATTRRRKREEMGAPVGPVGSRQDQNGQTK